MNWSPLAARRSPLLQVAKSAVATLVAWLVAGALVQGPPPVFAAIAALLTVQPSISQSFGRGVERTVGVVAGVVVASSIGMMLGAGFVSVALAVVAVLLIAWALRAVPGTANQMAISALLVLAIGTTTPHYAVDRIVETVIGAVIGLIVNIAIVPPVTLGPARERVAALTAGVGTALDDLGDALLSPQTTGGLTALLTRARSLRAAATAAESALADARDSLTLNPLRRRRSEDVALLERDVRRVSAIATQVIGMTRAFVDEYDDTVAGDPSAAAIAEQLHRAAHDVRMSPSGTTAPPEEPPALTRPLEIVQAPPTHWLLIGSMLVDLRRIHDGLAEADHR
ncbi:FUSC family protein [Microbacterium dextranolyticum]|uniref:FUSC family protein n=1 Tax=Microbacterium dextranolyticum TaxID=36806 RepID=A0A9W6HLP2_9MICO|nr:aromatic acid exporter family protein [Microbacterium dextranolyticum]MBM7463980.1 uncharacterized membrane protein YgaE (UPF0421/DUF939 family) [Microbacterium dextranolyticum]GLJ95059.1 FUSC family protein [Microbacterium dextranolyticum]